MAAGFILAGIILIRGIFLSRCVLIAAVLRDLLFRFVSLSDQILSALRCQVAPPKLMIADSDQSLLTAGELHFFDLIFDKRMLLQDVVAVMPVQNGFVPHNDRVCELSVSNHVHFKLLELLKTQRQNLSGKLGVYFEIA